MKRKIALLLASLMTFSMLPINALASSSNSLTGFTTTVPRYTLFLEKDWGNFHYSVTEKEVNAIDPTLGIPDADVPFVPATYATTTSAVTIADRLNPIRGKNGSEITGSTDVINYEVSGTNFVLRLDTSVKKGDSFRFQLTGGEWFFRNNRSTPGNYGVNAAGTPGQLDVNTPTAITNVREMVRTLGTGAAAFNPQLVYTQLPAAATTLSTPSVATYRYGNTNQSLTYPRINYNPNYGWYYSAGEGDNYGVYYRFGSKTSGGIASDSTITTNYVAATATGTGELAYALAVSTIDPSYAIMTILEDGRAGDGVVLPLVIRATASDSDIRLTVMDASTAGVFSTGTWKITTTGANLLTTAAIGSSTTTFRDRLALGRITIREQRLNSIKTNWGNAGRYGTTVSYDNSSTIQLIAPSGYYFGDLGNIKVGVEYGLEWQEGGVPVGMGKSAGFNIAENETTTIIRDASAYYGNVIIKKGYDYYVETRRTYSTYDYDPTVLEITLNNIKSSTNLLGTLYIEGVVLYSEENAGWGDVNIELRNKDNANRPVVTEQTALKAGVRTDWAVSLTARGTIPELVAGRYQIDQTSGAINGMLNSTDAYHRTAEVEFKENARASWWSERETIFTLSPGAKFRKVTFTFTENLDAADTKAIMNPDTPYVSTVVTQNALSGSTPVNTQALPKGTYVNDGIRQGRVMLSDTTLSITNVKVTGGNDKATIRFQPWVSLEVGHGAADVTLTMSDWSYNAGTTGATALSCIIAKRIDPVTISSQMTDIKIGYQYQPTADITITETKPGTLLRGKQILVTVSDLISMDMLITNDARVEVIEGDLKIGTTTTFGNGYATRNAGYLYGGTGVYSSNGGTIGFTIDRASSKPSTIKISNVGVKVDRTIPETNERPYKVVVWGSAIAENFGQNRDEFQTPGVMSDYLRVVSVAGDKPSVLTQEVRVSIGEAYVLVNGIAHEMDAAAYISPASNSTMIPIRFVGYAFGLTDDQIIWDNYNKTVTMIHPSRTIQFSAGSHTMVVDGAPITMISPDGLPVSAEIKGTEGHERMYIPFRALGQAFGVAVQWDATTQTALYNAVQ